MSLYYYYHGALNTSSFNRWVTLQVIGEIAYYLFWQATAIMIIELKCKFAPIKN